VVDDLEEDSEGRIVVARRVAADRIVSITDPDARSGRKTRSQPFKGYRLHVLGDIVSGVVLAVSVVPANTHDAVVGQSLIERAKGLLPELDQVLADTAYGATASRVHLAALGIDLVAPPQLPPKMSKDVVRKSDFNVDFEARTATCPQGVQSTKCREVDLATGPALQFVWEREPCAACPLQSPCSPRTRARDAPVPKKGRPPTQGKTLTLHTEEEALRAARDEWKRPERRLLYRRRAEVELLIANAVRSGSRKARAWGLRAARLQAHSIAMHLNLAVLAKHVPKE
jgi:hypothetical protein